jgi:membrane associated rhomboid family serine protease
MKHYKSARQCFVSKFPFFLGSLQKMGALNWAKVVHEHQGWRLISCIWLHAGLVHLIVNMLSLLFIGIRLEQQFGFGKLPVCNCCFISSLLPWHANLSGSSTLIEYFTYYLAILIFVWTTSLCFNIETPLADSVLELMGS